MAWRRILLWALLLGQLTVSGLLAIEIVTDGQGVNSAVYYTIQTLRGWPPHSVGADAFVRVGRFLMAWWFFGMIGLALLVQVVSIVYALLDSTLRVWQRLLWSLVVWGIGFVSIPIYCLFALRRLDRLVMQGMNRRAVA